MILVDTSAWVEYDRPTERPVDQRGDALTRQPGQLVVHRARHRRGVDRPDDFDAAAQIYRTCRARSTTPRGIVDCMIAAVAIRHDVPVLAQDVDLARIATVTALRLDEASLRVN